MRKGVVEQCWISCGWTLHSFLHSPVKCHRCWYITTSGSILSFT